MVVLQVTTLMTSYPLSILAHHDWKWYYMILYPFGSPIHCCLASDIIRSFSFCPLFSGKWNHSTCTFSPYFSGKITWTWFSLYFHVYSNNNQLENCVHCSLVSDAIPTCTFCFIFNIENKDYIFTLCVLLRSSLFCYIFVEGQSGEISKMQQAQLRPIEEESLST